MGHLCTARQVTLCYLRLRAGVGAAVAVLEPHDVVELRRRDLEHERILERSPAVHGSGLEAERAPGPDHLDVGRPPRLSDLELDAARVDEDHLVLLAVELKAELLAGADEQHLAEVAVRHGVDELVRSEERRVGRGWRCTSTSDEREQTGRSAGRMQL